MSSGVNVGKLAQILENAESSNKTRSGSFISSEDSNSSTTSAPDIVENGSLRFILIPLAVLLVILILSAVVYMMARRRRLARVYCKRKLAHNFGQLEDDSDSPLEQADMDDYDCDDPTEYLLKGKLQIDNRYERYQTSPVSPVAANRRELYT